MRSINDFRERMNHEFSHVNISLIIFGFKIDGEGLKKDCKLNNLKSVDYICTENNKTYFIEFSDLYRQLNSIINDKNSLENSKDLPKKLKAKIINETENIINKELVQKYKDTLLLTTKIDDDFSHIPETFLQKSYPYYVVISPFHPEIEESRKSEISRYLDALKNKITQAIPDKIFQSVKVIQIENFAKPNSLQISK